MIGLLLNDPKGRIVLSILLGLGFACIFRLTCKNNDCYIVKAPKSRDINDYVYKIDDKCFKYTPVPSKCDVSNPD